MMALIFHDIGKIPSERTSALGSSYFPKHEVDSAKMVKSYLPKKFPNYFTPIDIENIHFLVRNHMNMYTFFKMDKIKHKELFSNIYFSHLTLLHKCCIEAKGLRGDKTYLDLENLKAIEKKYSDYIYSLKNKNINREDKPKSKLDKFIVTGED
jgi:CRISPR/Cas system-associated endonuclease Cas3-HD